MPSTALKNSERNRNFYFLWFHTVWLIPESSKQLYSKCLAFFKHHFKGLNMLLSKNVFTRELYSRDRLRFFDQVGHQTTYAYIGNKHFFTKSCHCQTYQNYEQPPQSLQNVYFQSHFSPSKINRIFLIFFFKEYNTRRTTFTNEIFWKRWLLKYFVF